MNFQIERVLRHTHWVLLVTACVCVLGGCWQEVRYEPSSTDQVEQQADQATGQRGIELEQQNGQGDQALSTRQPVAMDVPAPKQAQETISAVAEEAGKDPADKIPIAGSESTRTAEAAWQLGSQWSLGAAIYAKGLPSKRYDPALELAASAAQMLHLELPPLPDRPTNEGLVTEVVSYLLDDQGPRLAEKLVQKYDARHAALMELAIRSHLLLLVYSPHNLAQGKGALSKEQFLAWVDRLAELANGSQLPEAVWNPLLEKLRVHAPYAEVKQAVFELHKQVASEHASAN